MIAKKSLVIKFCAISILIILTLICNRSSETEDKHKLRKSDGKIVILDITENSANQISQKVKRTKHAERPNIKRPEIDIREAITAATNALVSFQNQRAEHIIAPGDVKNGCEYYRINPPTKAQKIQLTGELAAIRASISRIKSNSFDQWLQYEISESSFDIHGYNKSLIIIVTPREEVIRIVGGDPVIKNQNGVISIDGGSAVVHPPSSSLWPHPENVRFPEFRK